MSAAARRFGAGLLTPVETWAAESRAEHTLGRRPDGRLHVVGKDCAHWTSSVGVSRRRVNALLSSAPEDHVARGVSATSDFPSP